MLDAFQSAAVATARRGGRVLVPLYRSTRPSRASSTRSSSDHRPGRSNASAGAVRHPAAQDLFLIRYVGRDQGQRRQPGHPVHRPRSTPTGWPCSRQIEESLQRLEKETWSAATATLLLPHQRRARHRREIKDVDLAPRKRSKLLCELIFEDVLGARPRCATATPRRTSASTACSTRTRTAREPAADLEVSVTPAGRRLCPLTTDAKCILRSAEGRPRSSALAE